MPDVLFSIDLKFSDATKTDLVYNAIAARNLENQVVWGSGHDAVHNRLIELDPDIALYFREDVLIKTYFLSLFGCLFCFPLEADVLMPPIMTSE